MVRVASSSIGPFCCSRRSIHRLALRRGLEDSPWSLLRLRQREHQRGHQREPAQNIQCQPRPHPSLRSSVRRVCIRQARGVRAALCAPCLGVVSVCAVQEPDQHSLPSSVHRRFRPGYWFLPPEVCQVELVKAVVVVTAVKQLSV